MKVIAIAVQSLDGFIARNHHDLVNWSSDEDKKLFAQETKKSGVTIVGRQTFKLFPHPLPDRLNIVLTSSPENFTSLPNSLEFTNQDPRNIIKLLEKRGFASAFVIGGQQVYTSFIQAKLIDEIWITIEPILIRQGLQLFTQKPNDIQFEPYANIRLNHHTIHLRYRIK